MAIVRSIGLPENDSERKAINYLKECLPDDYVIFTNMELPTKSGLPYEYDIIVVGEYAVYCLEVKSYKGEIRGNAFEWELNFLDSRVIYKSPIPLSNKKAKIVGDRLKNYMPILDKVWVQSLILLTDDNVKVKLNDPQANRVLHLKQIQDYLLDPSQLQVVTGPIGKLRPSIIEAIAGQFKPLHRAHEVGDYQILETVNKNNLYTTFLAKHKLLQLRNLFLLKVYSFNLYDSPDAQSKQRDWILRDATALLSLNHHDNIVQAYPPFAWLDSQIVLPVQWADGYSLKGLLESNENFNFERKIDIILQLLEAIKFAHENNIIHRDIRPENIIIPKVGLVKLVNFDCAHFEDDNIRTIATRVGKHLDQRYVAPEVWSNPAEVMPASDIYALGIVFFEMLVNELPYQKIKDVYEKKALPKLPTQVDIGLPAEVDEIVGGMCAFNPLERTKLTDLIELINIVR